MADRTDPENSQRSRLTDRWKHLPASVRDPSRQRLEAYVPDELEDDDEDLELLSTLAEEADRVAKAAPVTPPPPARRFDVKAESSLDVFRQTETARRRPRVLESFQVEDVEMDDLVEQLATTAAALRQRRAA
jgi:hypothetical protein